MPCRGWFNKPCKKNPRNKRQAQGTRGLGNDNANDSTYVRAKVADIGIPDGRRACEESHGKPRRHARCEDIHVCETSFRPLVDLAADNTHSRVIPRKGRCSPHSSHVQNQAMVDTERQKFLFHFYCKGATDRNRCQSRWGIVHRS